MDMHRSVSVAALAICILSLAGAELCRAQNSPGDFLAAHNRARAAVGVGPMTWNSNVAAYARNYAEQRRGDCALVHSSGPYGENIAWGSGDLSGVSAVEMWVAEKSEYDYGSNTCTGEDPMGCLHYTQVVWRNSTQLGCARVRCSTGGTFIICSYNPRGNYIGQRPYEELAMSI